MPEHEADSDEEMRLKVRLGINLGVVIVKSYDRSRAWWNLTTYETQLMRVRIDMSESGHERSIGGTTKKVCSWGVEPTNSGQKRNLAIECRMLGEERTSIGSSGTSLVSQRLTFTAHQSISHLGI